MQMVIDGNEVTAFGGQQFEVRNPAGGDVIDVVPRATPEDVDRALNGAMAAQRAWAARPSHERSAVLAEVARQIEAHADKLAELLCRENGKPLPQALREVNTTARIFAGYGHQLLATHGEAIELDRQPGLEQDLLVTRREPYGVVVAITPFNFPISVLAHKAAPALAAGNAVVAKPSEYTPLSTVRIGELMLEAGVPGGCFQVVTGFGGEIGDALVTDPKVAVVTLTGSIATGRRVTAAAAPNLTRVYLELGGNDPVLVFADSDLDLAATEIVNGRLPTNGQVCCANKRVLVEESVRGPLVERLRDLLATKALGDPFHDGTDLGPLIHEEAAALVHEQVEKTLEQGGTLVVGGEPPQGSYYWPTLIDDVPPTADVARDMEIFGPVLPVIGFADTDEAIQIANSSRCGLNAAVLTRDMQRALSLGARIQSGMVTLNGSCLYRPDACAFGGYKMSGIGREGVLYGLEEYSQVKTFAFRNVLA